MDLTDLETWDELARRAVEWGIVYENPEAIVALVAEVRRLHALLAEQAEDARDDVSHWGGYADDYFAEKWGLGEDVAKWERRRDLNRALTPDWPAV